jgi:hypothetical protein
MNTRSLFDAQSSSFLSSGPAIVRFFVPEKEHFIMTSNENISIISSPTFSADSTPTKDLLDRIRDLKRRYAQAWTPNGTIPKEDAYRDAKDFVLTLPLARIVRPSIHIAGDGEVNFEWRGEDFHIDLGFYGNRTFSYYATKRGSEPLFGDDIPVKSGIPRALADFASAV